MNRPITIIGGGLSGLGLGIYLRKEGVPVEIWDAAAYPRHRVCGEFLSGTGSSLLKNLVELPDVPHSQNTTVQFALNGRSTRTFVLPQPALAVTRYDLDNLLAQKFRMLGGTLHQHRRWTGRFDAAGIVRATGRRSINSAEGYIGLKLHAFNYPLAADLELHFATSGYVGVSRLPENKVNICGLFRQKFHDLKNDPISPFAAIVGERLRGVSVVSESFCSIASLPIRADVSQKNLEFRIGDSIAMIPPLTGNGMSLALESASAAAPLLLKYSRNLESWEQTQARFTRDCSRRFGVRLHFAFALQTILLNPCGARILLSSLRTLPSLFPILFKFSR